MCIAYRVNGTALCLSQAIKLFKLFYNFKLQNAGIEAIIIIMVSFEEKDKFAIDRDTMIRVHLAGRDITDQTVLKVMSELPREYFVPAKYESEAYADRPLPVGLGQTISQPYIV
ncbi:MAG: protein-L-isoaspartate O-methyltransferase family protein, partial [Planctomycetota bacterium]